MAERSGRALHARSALLPDGWARDVRVTLADSHIADVEMGTAAAQDDLRVPVLLPAPGNLHSHSFQRAMAGLGEAARPGRDSFWTWRTLMYRFLDRLTPDDVEAIAAQVFVEILEAGYAAVGEFHYLHHQPGGAPYEDRAELSRRIVNAAVETGIGLTHLPVLYQYGGARNAPLDGGQRRFGHAPDGFLGLLETCRSILSEAPDDARLGLAFHSLRACDEAGMRAVLEAVPSGPVHIHAAEQMREVEEIETWLGQRPIDWLLRRFLDPRWCVVHATHMTAEETEGLARSGAVAGLCPITEANLGDGIFPGPDFLRAGGRLGVGSDSNVRIALGEELRMLEYGQRLTMRARGCMVPEGGEGAPPVSTGETLWRAAAEGAAQALDRRAGRIAEGYLADLLAPNLSHPALAPLPLDALIDGMVFAAGDGTVAELWSAGRHVVQEGRHPRRETVEVRFLETMRRLIDTG
ncbi:MAG: formimidoylglutamate deiminase [Pseudomonadota bacterium]